MLKDSYFRIISKEAIESGFRFEEALNKKLSLKSINVCRFITLLTPQKGVHLQLEINLTDNNDSVDAKATISDDGITYVSYKGTFGLK